MVEPWIAPLQAGDPERAWNLFIERYRRVVFGGIRHYTSEHDEVMDVFARVCEALREDDFARLRRYVSRADPARPFSTWLVAVVHNLTIDWFRHRDGRKRIASLADSLPPIQRRIFEYVFIRQLSHVEAYEQLRTRGEAGFSFGEYLKELSATYRAVAKGHHGRVVAELAIPPPPQNQDLSELDPAVLAEQQEVVTTALEFLPPEDRLAVQMYVLDEMPADEVARILGYSSPKTVYNRVYRALASIRTRLERAGIKGGDL